MLVPECEMSHLNIQDRRRIQILHDWFSDPEFMDGKDTVILLSQSSGQIHNRISKLPQVLSINVPAPFALVVPTTTCESSPGSRTSPPWPCRYWPDSCAGWTGRWPNVADRSNQWRHPPADPRRREVRPGSKSASYLPCFATGKTNRQRQSPLAPVPPA